MGISTRIQATSCDKKPLHYQLITNKLFINTNYNDNDTAMINSQCNNVYTNTLLLTAIKIYTKNENRNKNSRIIRKCVLGCNSRSNFANRSRKARSMSRASSWYWIMQTKSSAYRTRKHAPRTCRLRRFSNHRSNT